jgi:hypothetical protein
VADVEVIGVTDDCLGAQRLFLFEILLDPRRVVITAQRGINAARDYPDTKCPGSTRVDPTIKNQRDVPDSVNLGTYA